MKFFFGVNYRNLHFLKNSLQSQYTRESAAPTARMPADSRFIKQITTSTIRMKHYCLHRWKLKSSN